MRKSGYPLLCVAPHNRRGWNIFLVRGCSASCRFLEILQGTRAPSTDVQEAPTEEGVLRKEKKNEAEVGKRKRLPRDSYVI